MLSKRFDQTDQHHNATESGCRACELSLALSEHVDRFQHSWQTDALRYFLQGMPGGAGGMLQQGATEEKGENARLVSCAKHLCFLLRWQKNMGFLCRLPLLVRWQ